MIESRGGFEYGDELNDHNTVAADAAKLVAGAMVGKTVEGVELFEAGTDSGLLLRFSDGSAVSVISWDCEGYSSGLYVFDRVPPAWPAQSRDKP
jgi:hypothetical protein